MKLSILSLLSLSLALALALANPIAEPETDLELDKRASCIVLNAGKFYGGTCVDVKKGKQCENGLLVTGWCGGGNTIICCVKGYKIGAPAANSGFGDAP